MMNRLFFTLIFLAACMDGYGFEDSQCFSTESERLAALEQIKESVKELSYKQPEAIVLEQLSHELTASLPEAIKGETILISGPAAKRNKNTLAHSCITSYSECGAQNSMCIVHFYGGRAYCKTWGINCD